MADDAVLKAIAEMSTELASMRTDMTSMRTELMGRMDGLEHAVAAKLTDLRSELISTRTGIMGRVDRLQNAVEAVRDDVAVNFGRADHVASIGKGVREEVQAIASQVSAMERQILRLRTEMDELRRGNP